MLCIELYSGLLTEVEVTSVHIGLVIVILKFFKSPSLESRWNRAS